jgi:uncharacterized glyoxalase superfamily protein PhnB
LSEGNPRGRKEHTVTAQTSTVTFYPSVLYRDADAAMNWLERALGFERREDHRDAEGHVAHAEMSLGPAIVMLGSAGAGREPFRSLPAGGSLIYCAVEDVDALYERAREAGAEIPLEPTETDYGSRDFTVRDPEGNLWAFGTYRPRTTR